MYLIKFALLQCPYAHLYQHIYVVLVYVILHTGWDL